MRKFAVVATAFIVGFILFIQTSKTPLVFADHGFDTLEVNECSAWEHVLQTNDQLYLCRYFVDELPHVDPLDILGAAGAVLRIKDGVGSIKSASVATVGHGLGAIYFDALDPLIPTLPDATLRVQIIENPAVFPTPLESTDNTPSFPSTTDLNTTRDDITAFLPRIMLRLEQADPDIEAETYVVGTGITAIGKVLVENTFSALITISPAAFILSTTNAGGGFGGSITPSFITTIRTTGQNSAFSIGIGQIGEFVGLPFTITVLVFCALIYGFVIFAFHRAFGASINRTLILWLWPSMLIGGFMGGTWLFELSIVLAGLTMVIGVAAFINRDIPT